MNGPADPPELAAAPVAADEGAGALAELEGAALERPEPPRRAGFWRNRRGQVRAPWRLFAFAVLALAFGQVAGLAVPLRGDAFGGDDALRYAVLCLAVVLASGVALIVLDRASAPLAVLGLGAPLAPAIGTAGVLGAGLMAGVFVLEWVAGLLDVERGGAPAAKLVIVLLVLLFAAALEELLFRGYPMQVLIQSIGARPGIGLMSVLFGLAHNLNPGANWLSLANTTAAGLLLSLAYCRQRSLWPAIGLHFAWNATLGPLLGLPVSGLGLETMVWDGDLTARGERLWWLTGGDYGPEGGLILSVLLVPALLLLGRRPVSEPRAPPA